MIRIGLVDDDGDHLQLVRSFIRRYEKEEGTSFRVEEYRNGLNFVEDYDGRLDVVFLDIEMPHMDGMTAAKKIREKDQALGIVFVTNMAQYAIRGYEVDAIDSIVKPVSYYVFADKLGKAIRFSERNKEKDFVLQAEDSIVKLTCSQIIYVEKDKNYLVFHTKKGDYRSRGTMAAMEESLRGEGFSKCISGCLINLRYVTGVDTCVDDLLEAVLSLAENKRLSASRDFDERDHHELARRGAAESTVLLKNEGRLLPLKPGVRVAVVGDFAFEPRYQGAASSMVNATKTETIVEETAHYHLQVIGSARGYERTRGENETLFTEAVSLAKTADVVLYFFGLDELSESEGMDRTHMKIPQNQIRLLEELFKVNPKVVGILSAGSAVEMSWEPCCKAIKEMDRRPSQSLGICPV